MSGLISSNLQKCIADFDSACIRNNLKTKIIDYKPSLSAQFNEFHKQKEIDRFVKCQEIDELFEKAHEVSDELNNVAETLPKIFGVFDPVLGFLMKRMMPTVKLERKTITLEELKQTDNSVYKNLEKYEKDLKIDEIKEFLTSIIEKDKHK